MPSGVITSSFLPAISIASKLSKHPAYLCPDQLPVFAASANDHSCFSLSPVALGSSQGRVAQHGNPPDADSIPAS